MIELKNITKVYKPRGKGKSSVHAVDHISLEFEEGSVVGLLGPNGAGKSTMIKMILGVLYPTEGEALINGMNSYQHRRKLIKDIGIVFGQRSQLWWDIPPSDTFELFRKMYGVEKEVFERTLKELINMLDVGTVVQTPVRFLSLGQRMKCEIIAALCVSPKIVILDEPTLGLDVVSKEAIRTFLKKINQERKVTILLATHDLADVEAICDRVIVINHGKILFDDSSETIRQMQERKREAEIIFVPDGADKKLPFVCEKEIYDGKQTLKMTGTSQMITEAVNWCFQNGDVEDVIIKKQSIEKIVIDLYNA